MVAQEANRFRAKPNKMLVMWQAASIRPVMHYLKAVTVNWHRRRLAHLARDLGGSPAEAEADASVGR